MDTSKINNIYKYSSFNDVCISSIRGVVLWAFGAVTGQCFCPEPIGHTKYETYFPGKHLYSQLKLWFKRSYINKLITIKPKPSNCTHITGA